MGTQSGEYNKQITEITSFQTMGSGKTYKIFSANSPCQEKNTFT